MAKNRGTKQRNKNKRDRAARNAQNVQMLQDHREIFFRQSIPETDCECCASNGKTDDSDDDAFDENGYPKVKKNAFQFAINPPAKRGIFTRPLSQIVARTKVPDKPFRFLDLPAELRNYIYELVCSQEKEIVCVRDGLLRPSLDMTDPENVLRVCGDGVICVPCQLHDELGTGNYALSATCKQLHQEMALIPLTVNFFSLHNLYYLEAFLSIIGRPGRKAVKKLRFDWKFPEEEERHALKTRVTLKKVYTYLLECDTLTTLWIDLDVQNLLTWNEAGERNHPELEHLGETPYFDYIYGLRELREVRLRWKVMEGIDGAEWAKVAIGVWRESRESTGDNVAPVEAEVTMDRKEEWACIHWKREEEV